MPAEMQNIKHKVGRKRTLIFGPVLDENGDFVDLSTSTARWRMAKSATSTGADIYVDKSTASSEGITIVEEFYVTDEPHYLVQVELQPEDTVNVTPCVSPQRYWHELEVRDVNDKPSTIASGYFDLEPSILNDGQGGMGG